MLCNVCGKEFDASGAIDACPYCKTPVSEIKAAAAQGAPVPAAPVVPPQEKVIDPSLPRPLWEEQGPWMKRLINTVKTVLFKPTLFFKSVPENGPLSKALIFGVIIGSIGGMFAIFWSLVLSAVMAVLGVGMGGGAESVAPVIMQTVFSVFYVIFLPVMMVMGIFIWGAILHLSLMIVGGNRRTIETTIRVVGYSNSTMIWNIIPGVGGLIAFVNSIFVVISGIRELHHTTTNKATLAYIIPLACLFLCAFCIAVIAFGMVGLGSLASLAASQN